jgi:hypothetical protein
VGTVIGLLILFALTWLLGDTHAPTESWVLFGAAGFGWATSISAALITRVEFLRQPNSWVERKRKGKP